jgi:hypothetical protein
MSSNRTAAQITQKAHEDIPAALYKIKRSKNNPDKPSKEPGPTPKRVLFNLKTLRVENTKFFNNQRKAFLQPNEKLFYNQIRFIQNGCKKAFKKKLFYNQMKSFFTAKFDFSKRL